MEIFWLVQCVCEYMQSVSAYEMLREREKEAVEIGKNVREVF